MKQPKTTPEKPVTATKAEQPVAPKATKAAPKKTGSTKPTQKKTESAAMTETKIEQPVVAVATDVTPKKPTAKPRTAKKIETVISKPEAATPEVSITERVGLTAGSIWHYLSENGATSASKLIAALNEEEKIIQRSIGWLAQEDKINIDTDNRVETITLKA